jgi:ribonucleoside-diphosphate reductase alpha chain
MGFADVLISLGIPYNSQEAVDKAEEIMKFVQETAHKCSSDLAVERGNFPNYNKSFYKDKEIPMRNATVTTIAPTGTISLICGASSGIEPIFALCYTRNIMDNQKFYEVYSLFEKIAKKENIYSQKFLDELVQKGSLAHFEEVSENIKKVFVTAHDIQPEWHIKIQAAFQKYTDNAVSKTINFKKDTTVEEIKETYLKAYEFGCKGITIYRDGSRTGQVLTVGDNSTEKENNEEVKVQVKKIIPKRRPDILTGKTVKMLTGCGLMYITLNEDENGNLFEIFSHLGKAGGCASSQSQAIGRLASLCLRTGVNPDEIVKQLIGISCHLRSGFGENAVYSCSDAVAKAIALHQNNKNKKYKTKSEIFHSYDLKKDGTSLRSSSTENGSGSCPDCGGIMEHEGGCSVCKVCGFSRCG